MTAAWRLARRWVELAALPARLYPDAFVTAMLMLVGAAAKGAGKGGGLFAVDSSLATQWKLATVHWSEQEAVPAAEVHGGP